VLYEARRRKFPVEPPLPFKERRRVTLAALPALLVPFVVMVGIYGGFVTVTEAAALSAIVALCVSLLFYRGFQGTETLSVVSIGLRSAASIMLIIATALAVGHWLTESGVPARLVEFLLSHQFSTRQFLLAINGLLLVLGCFLEVTATLLLVLPVLAPALGQMGVDPSTSRSSSRTIWRSASSTRRSASTSLCFRRSLWRRWARRSGASCRFSPSC
jgi:C4-dicarboxylate transporter DctM subunit